MSITFHLLRPYWLLGVVPVFLLCWFMLRQTAALQGWRQICDPHLLPHLIETRGTKKHMRSIALLIAALTGMILGLSGPTFTRLPVPVYQHQLAHVVLLDLSNQMLATDLSPSRLQRAKFKLHDLFQHHHEGQFALIAYTGEPFVVSPLTDDAETITSLLHALTPEIMPVGGNQLDKALLAAEELIEGSGLSHGDILVLTAETPSISAIDRARELTERGVQTSVLPMIQRSQISPLFEHFAAGGKGHVFPFSNTNQDIDEWLSTTKHELTFQKSKNDAIPRWRDEGRWFLIPALLALWPLFRRGWLQRIRP